MIHNFSLAFFIVKMRHLTLRGLYTEIDIDIIASLTGEHEMGDNNIPHAGDA